MRTMLRSKVTLLFLSLGMLLAMAGVAFADIVVPDGDLVTSGDQGTVDLGTVKGGAQLSKQVSFTLECQTNNHVDDAQGVDIVYDSANSTIPTGATLGATSAHIGVTSGGPSADKGVPSSWPDDGTNCSNPEPTPVTDTGNSTVTITAPSAEGTYNFTLKYNATPTPAGNADDKALQGNGVVTVTYTLKVDNTGPAITINTPPTPSATYNKGQVVNASYSCVDGAGVATCSGPVASGSAIDTSTTGTKTFTVNASDTLGNTSTLSRTYTVVDPTPVKQNQTISFAADTPTSKTFGDADFNVSATATSGLTVSYAAKAGSSCTVNSTTGLVHLTGAGTCTVVASQAGNANYFAAPNVEQVISVDKATPNVTWSAPANITYGTALGNNQLNAQANVPGSFSYDPQSGTVLNAGTHTLTANFTPTNTTDYKSTSKTVSLTVEKANPVISWSNPTAIDYGTALSSTQLNAQANVPGSFSYDPQSGTVLNAGTRTLTANFTPTDTANYNNVNGTTVQIVVKPLSFGNGFFQPVDNRILNGVKGGSTVPMKFEVFQSLSGTELKSTSAIKTWSTTKVSCDTAAATGEDAIEEYTTGNTSLRFDTTGDQFILNWQAPKATASAPVGTCYQVTIVANDGSSPNNVLTALYKIK